MRPSRHFNSVPSIDTVSRSFVPARSQRAFGERVRHAVFAMLDFEEGASSSEELPLVKGSTKAELQFPARRVRQFLFALARQHHDEPGSLFDIHRGVVHQHGIGRAHQRRYSTFAVAAIAVADFF
jgi:hypothetical protein